MTPDEPDTDHPGRDPDPRRRAIRSFVVRAGRMTVAQERAWTELWPRYGVETTEAPLDFVSLFGRDAPRTLEIGFGNGESLVALAAAHPGRDYLGLEVHRPGVGHLMLRAEELGLTNVRAICRDAVEVLQYCIPAATLDEVLLYFPDPWPKKRHHKRRLLQSSNLEVIIQRLKPGGQIRLATDHEEYFQQMQDVTKARSDLLEEIEFERPADAREGERTGTNYERKYVKESRAIHTAAFRRRIDV